MEEQNTTTQVSYAALLQNFKDALLLLRAYMDNPVGTTDKILNSTLPEKDKFVDVRTGLGGEFTKARAAEIGRNILVTHIEKLIQDLKQQRLDVPPVVEELNKTILEAYRILNNNVDTQSISRRKEKVTSHVMYTDYFKSRLDTILNAKLTAYPSVLDVQQLLFGFREILSMLAIYNQDELNDKYRVFKYRIEFLANNYIAIGTNNFKAEQFKIETTPYTENHNSQLDKYLSEVLKEQVTDEDNYTIFNSIVDILERVLTKIKENIEKLYSTVIGYTGQPELFNTILDNINVKLVQPYAKLEILTEDYAKRSNDSLMILDNLHSTYEEFLISIKNIYTKINLDLNIYATIYAIIDEVSVNGSIIERNINLK